MDEEVKFAVCVEGGHRLIGIEAEGFNLIRLGENYGEGVYIIHQYRGRKVVKTYYQTVDKKLGPSKVIGAVSSASLPGPLPDPPPELK